MNDEKLWVQIEHHPPLIPVGISLFSLRKAVDVIARITPQKHLLTNKTFTDPSQCICELSDHCLTLKPAK